MKRNLSILLLFILLITNSFAQNITNNGNVFIPDTLHVYVGDTITFNIGQNHNAVQVSESTWLSGGTTPINGGFNIPYAGGSWIADSIKTYYYVCQPHASMGMKGVIVSSCNKTLTQELKGFSPNPVYSLWDWSYDTLTLTNTSGCDVRVRPEFTISLDNGQISPATGGSVNAGLAANFNLKLYNSQLGNWPTIPYSINTNGDVVGSLGFPIGDTTGIFISPGVNELIIKVQFRPGADYGTYCSVWETQEVDPTGNFIQNLSSGSTCLSLVDCANFEINNSSFSNISCFNAADGSASILSILNGSNDYNYNWNNGDTTSQITNLNAGNYYCIVTDKNWQQCSDSIGFSITEPSILTATTSSTNVSCFGFADGYANATGGGGIPGYTYTWSDGQTTSTATSLSAGTSYNCTITDNNGCELTTPNITITQPLPINIVLTPTNTSTFGINDGMITSLVTGGTPAHTYSWTGPNGFTNNGSQSLNNLEPGIYTLTIIDANGCMQLDSTVINNAGCNITINASQQQPILCNGDSAYYDWNISNGVAPYSTNLTSGSGTTYWQSNSGNQVSNFMLPSGVYNLSVVDSVGCSNFYQFAITEPSAITATATSIPATCFGANDGSATVINTSGGTGAYTYSWNTTPVQTNPTATALSAGTYACTITDANGCNNTIITSVTEPTTIIASTSSIDVSCYGYYDGEATVNVIGGTPFPGGGYTYLWDDPLGQTTNTAVGLPASIYTCTITDAAGCMIISNVIIDQPTEITASTSLTDVSCNGYSDGEATVNAIGGTPFTGGGYMYSWNTTPVQITATAANLTSGTYECTITDANGCNLISPVTITEPIQISISVWISGNNLIATSGLASYQWYDGNGNPIAGANDSIFTPSNQGVYYVSVTDNNGCSENSFTIYITLNIQDYSLDVKIYPNPTNSKIRITSDKHINSIELFNTTGNQLLSVNKNDSYQPETEIDLSTFAKGVYYIRININNQIINQRIILQ